MLFPIFLTKFTDDLHIFWYHLAVLHPEFNQELLETETYVNISHLMHFLITFQESSDVKPGVLKTQYSMGILFCDR